MTRDRRRPRSSPARTRRHRPSRLPFGAGRTCPITAAVTRDRPVALVVDRDLARGSDLLGGAGCRRASWTSPGPRPARSDCGFALAGLGFAVPKQAPDRGVPRRSSGARASPPPARAAHRRPRAPPGVAQAGRVAKSASTRSSRCGSSTTLSCSLGSVRAITASSVSAPRLPGQAVHAVEVSINGETFAAERIFRLFLRRANQAPARRWPADARPQKHENRLGGRSSTITGRAFSPG